MAGNDAATIVIICWTPTFLGVLFALAFANTRFHWTRLQQAGIAAAAILFMIGILLAGVLVGGHA